MTGPVLPLRDDVPTDARIFVETGASTSEGISLETEDGSPVPANVVRAEGSETAVWIEPAAELAPSTSFAVNLSGARFPFTTGTGPNERPPVIAGGRTNEVHWGGVCGGAVGLSVVFDGVEDDAIEFPPLVRADVESRGTKRTAYTRNFWRGGVVVELGHNDDGLASGGTEASCLGSNEIGPIETGTATITVRVYDRGGAESAPVTIDTEVTADPPGGCGDGDTVVGCSIGPAAPQSAGGIFLTLVLTTAVAIAARRSRRH